MREMSVSLPERTFPKYKNYPLKKNETIQGMKFC